MRQPPAITIRDATAGDAAVLAAFARLAGHGLMDLFYEGLVPGRSVLETIMDRRICSEGSFSHWSRWRVAVDEKDRALGGLNAFPHAVFLDQPSDPLLTGWRMDLTAGLWDMELALGQGSFYLNMIAVDPELRRLGIGHLLMDECLRLASRSGQTRVTLSTFEADGQLMAFYARHGFTVEGRTPIPDHPALDLKGDWVLLARETLTRS